MLVAVLVILGAGTWAIFSLWQPGSRANASPPVLYRHLQEGRVGIMSITIDDIAWSHMFSMRLCAIQSSGHIYIKTYSAASYPWTP